MRHGRAKAARRTLQFFHRHGINPPYQVLLDGTFLVGLIKVQLEQDLLQRLDKLLQHAKFSLVTTRSVLTELEQLKQQQDEAKNATAVEIFSKAHQWAVEHCRVMEVDDPVQNEKLPTAAAVADGSTIGANNETKKKKARHQTLSTVSQEILCLLETSNSHRTNEGHHHHSSSSTYVLASHDEELLSRVRGGNGSATTIFVPIIRLQRAVLLLEQPSKSILTRSRQDEYQSAVQLTAGPEKELVDLLHQQRRQEKSQQNVLPEHQRRQQNSKSKKAKGPNPLSCKKKKATTDSASASKRRKTDSGG